MIAIPLIRKLSKHLKHEKAKVFSKKFNGQSLKDSTNIDEFDD